jgi:AmmeMemoRadiSam system protein A
MNNETGRILINLARSAIESSLGIGASPLQTDQHWLRAPGATYVTLLHDNKLRGRTGTLKAHRPLADDVAANAIAAACSDLRFRPLTRNELPDIRIEICLLSEIEPIIEGREAAALARLRPGVDGVIFEYCRHHSTFLPEAWGDAADPAEFMAQLKYKAGLPPDFWDFNVKLSRFTVSRWDENGLLHPLHL